MQDGKVKVVVNIERFLEEEFGAYKKSSKAKRQRSNVVLTDDQKKLVSFLVDIEEWASVDELVTKTELRMDAVMSELTMLEMQGVVKEMRVWVYGIKG